MLYFNKLECVDIATNIRLGWKCGAMKNNLAYYDTAAITTVKSFIVQARYSTLG